MGNFAQYTVFRVGKQTNLHQGPDKLRETFASEIRLRVNPFAPEPPVTPSADPGPFYPLWRHQF